MKNISQEEFNQFIHEDLHSALFHIMPEDLDDTYGIRLDELILIQILSKKPEVLQYKSLEWFVHHYINEIKN